MALKCFNKEQQLPSKATPGDTFYVSATKATYFALPDGSLLNLNDLLSGSVPHVRTVGPAGEQGVRGIDGVAGRDGRDGHDGRDSDVPGPVGPAGPPGKSLIGPQGSVGAPGRDGKDGESIIGPQGPRGEKGDSIIGPQGPRGDVVIPNESELAAAVIELRQQRARVQAAFLQAILDAESMQSSLARSHLLIKLNEVKRNAGL